MSINVHFIYLNLLLIVYIYLWSVLKAPTACKGMLLKQSKTDADANKGGCIEISCIPSFIVMLLRYALFENKTEVSLNTIIPTLL